MRYKALLLDFYGTLVVDDDQPALAIAQAIADASSMALDAQHVGDVLYGHMERLCEADQMFRTLRQVEIESLALTQEQFQTQVDLTDLTARLFAYWQAPDVFPEAHEFMQHLQQALQPFCLVSDVDTGDLEAALRYTGWSFAQRVTSEACRAYKPRPEMFERALTLLNCQAHKVLHIGNSWSSDVCGAQALGIDAAWVNRDGGPVPDDAVQPTFIVKDLRDLYATLDMSSIH